VVEPLLDLVVGALPASLVVLELVPEEAPPVLVAVLAVLVQLAKWSGPQGRWELAAAALPLPHRLPRDFH